MNYVAKKFKGTNEIKLYIILKNLTNCGLKKFRGNSELESVEVYDEQ